MLLLSPQPPKEGTNVLKDMAKPVDARPFAFAAPRVVEGSDGIAFPRIGRHKAKVGDAAAAQPVEEDNQGLLRKLFPLPIEGTAKKPAPRTERERFLFQSQRGRFIERESRTIVAPITVELRKGTLYQKRSDQHARPGTSSRVFR